MGGANSSIYVNDTKPPSPMDLKSFFSRSRSARISDRQRLQKAARQAAIASARVLRGVATESTSDDGSEPVTGFTFVRRQLPVVEIVRAFPDHEDEDPVETGVILMEDQVPAEAGAILFEDKKPTILFERPTAGRRFVFGPRTRGSHFHWIFFQPRFGACDRISRCSSPARDRSICLYFFIW